MQTSGNITKLHICLVSTNARDCLEWLVFLNTSLYVLDLAVACIYGTWMSYPAKLAGKQMHISVIWAGVYFVKWWNIYSFVPRLSQIKFFFFPISAHVTESLLAHILNDKT